MEFVRQEFEKILEDYPVYCADYREQSNQILIELDSDAGVDIGTIAMISRRLNRVLDENDFSEQWSVDIGTTGVGNNFKDIRQYNTNVGRTLDVVLNDGKSYRGDLACVSSDHIWISLEKTVKKIEKEEIDKSKVVIV